MFTINESFKINNKELLFRLSLIIFYIFFFSVSFSNAQDKDINKPVFKEYVVEKKDLNTPISPYHIYFFVETIFCGRCYIKIMIQRNQKISHWAEGYESEACKKEIETQLIPHYYEWQLHEPDGTITHRWLAYFLCDRDGTYHTIVSIPKKDFKKSWLEIYFINIDSDLTQENISFKLDMTKYNWEDRQVIQSEDE